MYFHEIAEELKIYMAPSERGGIFVVQLIGDTLRAPMTEEEEKMALDDKFNPLANGMSLNMQDQIFEGKKFISRNRAGLICSRYDGADFAEEIDNLYDADKDHLQMFLAKKGISVAIEELGSAMQDIMSQIFHGLSKGIHDVDICLTIHEPKPSIKNLAENRIYFDDGKLVIDGDTIELPIKLDESQIYEFESGYISALCDAYAEALSRDEVTVDDIPNLPLKYQMNFYDQRKAYLSAESIQRSISEVYEDGENQFDILKEDALAEFIESHHWSNGWDVVLIKSGTGIPYDEPLQCGEEILEIEGTEKRKILADKKMISVSGTKLRVGAGGCTRIGLTKKEIQDAEEAYRNIPGNANKKNIPDKAYLIANRDPILMLHIIQADYSKSENKDLPEFLFALGVGFPKTSGSTETANYKVNLIELRNWVDVYDNYDDDEDM